MVSPYCTAISASSGTRCRLRTKVRHPYCWIHTKSVLGLVVKKSTIPGSGLGLFAAKDFLPKKRDKATHRVVRQPAVVGVATGVEHTQAWADAQPDSNTYIISQTGKVIDQSDPQRSSVTRYANSCRPYNQHVQKNPKTGKPYCKKNNTVLQNNGGTLSLKASTKVKKGDEIFWAYGPGYWGKENEANYEGKSEDKHDDDTKDDGKHDGKEEKGGREEWREMRATELREMLKAKKKAPDRRLRSKKARAQARKNYPNSTQRKKKKKKGG